MTIYGCRQQNNNKKQQQDNLANLEASLAPAEAEFGAVAKADQKLSVLNIAFEYENVQYIPNFSHRF